MKSWEVGYFRVRRFNPSTYISKKSDVIRGSNQSPCSTFIISRKSSELFRGRRIAHFSSDGSEGIANSSPFAFPANQCAWPASPPHFSSQSQFEKVRRGGENVTDLSPLQCNKCASAGDRANIEPKILWSSRCLANILCHKNVCNKLSSDCSTRMIPLFAPSSSSLIEAGQFLLD